MLKTAKSASNLLGKADGTGLITPHQGDGNINFPSEKTTMPPSQRHSDQKIPNSYRHIHRSTSSQQKKQRSEELVDLKKKIRNMKNNLQ